MASPTSAAAAFDLDAFLAEPGNISSSNESIHEAIISRSSSASDAARKLDESRLLARSARTSSMFSSPHSFRGEPLDDDRSSTSTNGALVKTSSASAAAALLESTANRLRLQPRVSSQALQVALPGKISWTYPKPIVPNGPVAAPIPPDYSWIMTGGNTWSNKHRQTRDSTAAFFSNSRPARERIHWRFPENQDHRVADMLAWVQNMAPNLAAIGVTKFLESRERGALFINAAFRTFQHTSEPELDWFTFDQLQITRDRVLQESTAFYNPARLVVVFVYLPSPTGNSVAIWRRKISVPNGTREKYISQINGVAMKLRLEKDYIVMIDG